MKLIYLTAILPYGPQETFLRPELRSLGKIDEVIVTSTRPQQKNVEYADVGARAQYLDNLDATTLKLAWREFRSSPGAVLKTLAAIVVPWYRPLAKIKNLALFPKALAFTQIVRREGIEHIHAQWITTPATIAFIASRLTGVPWSITAHQHDIFSDNMLTTKVREAQFTRVISARNCRFLQGYVAPEVASRCVTVYLGVDIPVTIVEPPEREIPRIICAARLGIWKGHTVLIDALVELRRRGLEFSCDFAGEGELRKQVEAALAASQLGDRVRLLGRVDHEILTASLAGGDYDCFVLASTEAPGEHEGVPIAIMEAMAAGLPVVSTVTGSIDELVTPETGSLVPQRDPLALADALEPLLRDRNLRRAVGQRARDHVRANFSTETTTKLLRSYIRGEAVTTPPRSQSAAIR